MPLKVTRTTNSIVPYMFFFKFYQSPIPSKTQLKNEQVITVIVIFIGYHAEKKKAIS